MDHIEGIGPVRVLAQLEGNLDNRWDREQQNQCHKWGSNLWLHEYMSRAQYMSGAPGSLMHSIGHGHFSVEVKGMLFLCGNVV